MPVRTNCLGVKELKRWVTPALSEVWILKRKGSFASKTHRFYQWKQLCLRCNGAKSTAVLLQSLLQIDAERFLLIEMC